MTEKRKIMLSAIQPSSFPHLGNYLGAIRNWARLQGEYDCFFFAVDLHTITVPQDPEALRKTTREVLAFYIAAGLDPDHATLFLQSHVPEHSQLAWVLMCSTWMGELSRMTQFKDKSSKQGANIVAGLFTYPVLMAADILLYQSEVIPVGEDQKQHVELARDLAIRFNNRFEKKLFVVPEPLIQKTGARIMDLQEPTRKMSKSAENPKGVIFMNESDKEISKKIKSAVTDSGTDIAFTDDKPGIKNLIQMQCAILGKTPDEIVASYEGKMYGHLKVDTADLVVETVRPIRERTQELLKDPQELDLIMKKGAEKARIKAAKTLAAVYESVGFLSTPIK